MRLLRLLRRRVCRLETPGSCTRAPESRRPLSSGQVIVCALLYFLEVHACTHIRQSELGPKHAAALDARCQREDEVDRGGARGSRAVTRAPTMAPVIVDLITPPASPVRDAASTIRPVESRKRPAAAEYVDQEDDEDACVEVAAPQAAPPLRDEADDHSDEIVFCGRTGAIALSDYPHARADCCVQPWSHGAAASSKMQHCQMCYCFVCDVPAAECSEWREHSQACGDDPHWRALREVAKRQRSAGPASTVAPTAAVPATQNTARLDRPMPTAAGQFTTAAAAAQAMETVRRVVATATARSAAVHTSAPSVAASSVAPGPVEAVRRHTPTPEQLLHAYRCKDPSCQTPSCAATKLILKRMEAHAKVCPVRAATALAASLASSGGCAQLSPAATAMRLECKICRIYQLIQSRCGGGSSLPVAPLPSVPSPAGGVDAAALVTRLRDDAALTLHEKGVLAEICRLYTTKAIPKSVFYQRVKSLVGLPKLKEAITSLAAAATAASAGAPAAALPQQQQQQLQQQPPPSLPRPRAAPASAFRVNVQAATSGCCGRRAPVSSPTFVSASRQQSEQAARASPTTWRPGARLRLRIRVDRVAGLAWPMEEVEC